GEQTFRIKIIPHDGDWTAINLPRLAEEFTTPAPILLQGIHAGARPQSASFLSIDAANITVTAIKQAEDNNDLVFRCHETAGRATSATLSLHFANKQWTGLFRPHEIKTLRLDQTSGLFRETNALED
ncbi:MAG: glycosyl hydrolase-related protein, partial [Opitutaceae bacterium]|nr:glycosyl hydrolase-related protein [Opitutaceae bacterium]